MIFDVSGVSSLQYDGQNDPRPPPQPRFVIPDLEKEADERHARQVIVQQAKGNVG